MWMNRQSARFFAYAIVVMSIFNAGQISGFQLGHDEAFAVLVPQGKELNLTQHGEVIYLSFFRDHLLVFLFGVLAVIATYLSWSRSQFVLFLIALSGITFWSIGLLMQKADLLMRSQDTRYPYHDWLISSSVSDLICVVLAVMILIGVCVLLYAHKKSQI
ncbi:MAG: hypothetical protein KF881_07485 [Acidobacteria bacterium]|nr:hypothetical protein [Acidobacteriota bacterium]